ncbi:MAG: Importin subunit alpha-4 [Marteilia pararefringens]
MVDFKSGAENTSPSDPAAADGSSGVAANNFASFASIKEEDILQKQKLSNEKTKVELRKKKFQEQLSKNRTADFDGPVESYSSGIQSNNFNDSQANYGCQISEFSNIDIEYVDFEAISQTLKTKSIEEIYDIVQRIRKVLSNTKKNSSASNCLDDLVKSPFLGIIAEIMDQSLNDDLNYEISWILINVAAGNTQQAESIVNCGAMTMLMNKIRQNPTEKVKSHILWIFANVIGDGPDLRNKCLELGILPLVYELVFEPNVQSQTIKHYLAWIISNILRPTKQAVSDDIMNVILDMLEKLISMNPDKDVVFDLVWSLFYMQTSVERRGLVIKRGLHIFLMNHLNSESEKNQKAALRALSTLTITQNEDMQILLDHGYIESFAQIFESKPEVFKLDVLMAFGNIAIGFVNQKRMLISHPIFGRIIARVSSFSDRLQREVCFMIANLICTNDSDFLKELLDKYDSIYNLFFRSFIGQINDVSLITRNLGAANMLLTHQENIGRDIALLMEKEGVLEAIENFQMHSNDEVYNKSTQIIKTFFSSDEMGEDNLDLSDSNKDQAGNKFNF